VAGSSVNDEMKIQELYTLGYNAVQSDEIQQMFRRNISSPSSGSKNKPMKNISTVLFANSFHTCFFLALFFDPEDGGDIFLRNYPIIFLQELRKTKRKFSQYERRPGRGSNQTHPEVYSATAEQTCPTNHLVSTLAVQSAVRATRSFCKYHITFEVQLCVTIQALFSDLSYGCA
jgi:hypothetical protein